MIHFTLNEKTTGYSGNVEETLLNYLRDSEGLTAVKDGCSGQATCGACLVEVNGKARLSCTLKMKDLEGAKVITPEGIPEEIRDIIAHAFVSKGAIQCGFCTPGLIMRTKILLGSGVHPTKEAIRKAIHPHLCRCTGYQKIVEAIEASLLRLEQKSDKEQRGSDVRGDQAGIGQPYPKYGAYETAIGKRKFIHDMKFPGMLYGALRFSDHPRAKVLRIDVTEALKTKGVVKIITSGDIPGNRFTGLIFSDWPLMVSVGETTCYIGDVLAGVVARDERTARKAAGLIRIDYDVLPPVTDVFSAMNDLSAQVHPGTFNILEKCTIRRGIPADRVFSESKFIVSDRYETQRVEHAFLETEAAIALPEGSGIRLLSQGQGIYVDQRQVASILNLDEDRVRVTQIPCGGGFGGREDLTVQGHAALFSWLTKKPVKVHLTREESIRMHPKRHPVIMDLSWSCDDHGILTGLKLRAAGDTGAYASVGTKVMERVAGHASGAYHIPSVDIESFTVYTNNIPSGAMRGFGVNQVTFALESCMDELCRKGGFDRWKFRYDNALDTGKMTATGQVLTGGIGIKPALLALKDSFYEARYAGLACGIKNSGVGNGMVDFSEVRITIRKAGRVLIEHGWTEMGQGIHTMAIQILSQETGIDPDLMDVSVDTSAELPTGMTTSSRATVLLGNAIIDAAHAIREDLDQYATSCVDMKGHKLQRILENLAGNVYHGKYQCDWTTAPGADTGPVVTHFSYGYAAQLVILDDSGKIKKVYAAHDAGRVINPVLFEGQIEGAVHMGLGYALTEDLPMKEGRLESTRLSDCGVLRSTGMPEIVVIGIEETDPVGPYGAKGVGEIGLVPTAAAVANALFMFDGVRRKKLPMLRQSD